MGCFAQEARSSRARREEMASEVEVVVVEGGEGGGKESVSKAFLPGLASRRVHILSLHLLYLVLLLSTVLLGQDDGSTVWGKPPIVLFI